MKQDWTRWCWSYWIIWFISFHSQFEYFSELVETRVKRWEIGFRNNLLFFFSLAIVRILICKVSYQLNSFVVLDRRFSIFHSQFSFSIVWRILLFVKGHVQFGEKSFSLVKTFFVWWKSVETEITILSIHLDGQ